MLEALEVVLVERNVERGEKVHHPRTLMPGDSLTVGDQGARDGGPPPVKLEYAAGRLTLIVWSEPC